MSDQLLTAYGQQLIFDGYGADAQLCNNVDHLYQFLMQLPEKIGMTRMGFPHIMHIDEPGIVGLSGFVFIMESHISIHTYAERGFVTADVYSCKTFDSNQVRQHLQEYFDIVNVEVEELIRGKQFHQQSVSSPSITPVAIHSG